MSPLRELSSVQRAAGEDGKGISDQGMRNIDRLSDELKGRKDEIKGLGYHERKAEVDRVAEVLQKETGISNLEKIAAKKEIDRKLSDL